MRKDMKLILILMIVSVLVACKSAPITGENNTMEKTSPMDMKEEDIITIADYYPFLENTILDYEGIGNEFAEQTTFFEFIQGNKAQIKINNPGTSLVRVVEYSDGVLREIYSEAEFYHIENMLEENPENSRIILKEPLEIGTTWTNPEGYTVKITALDEDIETPYGNYKALEVTEDYGNGGENKYYYARDIGYIGSIYTDGDFQVKTLLKDIQKKPITTNIKAYYLLKDEIDTRYIEQDLVFNTNDNIEEIFTDILMNPASNKFISPITSGAKIKDIYLDRGSWVLKVDFSKEFLLEMNAGSSFETEILNSIVNTLGKFYDVEKVYISVEGKPYASGHYALREGEYFTVDNEIEILD